MLPEALRQPTAQLRWVLLLAGIVFLAILAVLETRRARRLARVAAPSGGERRPEQAGGAHAEPELGQLPDEFANMASAASPLSARDAASLPVILVEPPQAAPDSAATAAPVVPQSPAVRPVPVATAAATAEPAAPGAASPGAAAPVGTAEAPQAPAARPPLRIDWPPEGERQILSLRIVGAGERLSGRAARQALAACGFVHADFRIYHLPGEDGRALLSCANLSRPGTFDPDTMDFQRFTGLCLFTVLPGALSPAAAFEQLLEVGEELAQRCHGTLLDDRGQPLDQARLEALRVTLEAGPGVGSAGRLGAEPAA